MLKITHDWDTTHYYEVAIAPGADCLLISTAHQNRERLQSCGVPVLDDISDVLKIIEL